MSGLRPEEAKRDPSLLVAAAIRELIRELDDAQPIVEVPGDLARPRRGEGSSVVFSEAKLPALSTAALAEVMTNGVTMRDLLLCVWSVVAGRSADVDEVLVGLYDHLGDPNQDNVRIARLPCAPSTRFMEVVAAAQRAWRQTPVPLDELVRAVGVDGETSVHPVFQIAFSVGHRAIRRTGTPCDLELQIDPPEASFDGREVSMRLAGLEGLFLPSRLECMLEHVGSVVAQLQRAPDSLLGMLQLPGERELAAIADWEGEIATVGSESADVVTVAALFEAQAKRTPDAVAIEFNDAHLSYRELDAKSDELSRSLRSIGAGPNVRIALRLERGFDMVVSLLAIAKCNAAYVPIDPSYPAQRQEFMVDSAAVAATIRHEQGVLVIDRNTSARPSIDPLVFWDPNNRAENLGYVIFTSGSTGQPKGVALPERALVNLLQWQLAQPTFSKGRRTLQFTALSFDVSYQEIVSTLISGGTLVLVTEAIRRDSRALLRHIISHRIERLFLPFVALHGVIDAAVSTGEMPDCLREIYTAGEQVRVDDAVRKFFLQLPDCRFENQYGPSESHVATAFALSLDPTTWEALPSIGRPIGNTIVRVVNGYGLPVPIGVPGELLIGGRCLAHGYLGDLERTAERFVVGAAVASNERFYKTGDRVRWRDDGNLQYIGRTDNQVKFRGYRIEPGEIAAVLANHPAVAQALVDVREIEGGKRLVAYLVPTSDPVGLNEVRLHAKATLPAHMVPSHFVTVPTFPLTPSGKVDVRSLPTPQFDRSVLSAKFEAAESNEEIRLTLIWSELLGVADLGVNDDFFELGGDSLMAVEMFARIQTEIGMELPLGALAQYPTIRGLAAVLNEDRKPGVLIALRTTGDQIPIFCVHGGTGNVASFPKLARALGEDQPFYALQWDGLDGSPGTQGISSMAERYLREVRSIQPRGPYILFGQCVGGLIAHEMARMIVSAGDHVQLLVLFDSPNTSSPHYRPTSARVHLYRLAKTPPRARIERFKKAQRFRREARSGGVPLDRRVDHAVRSMVKAVNGHRVAFVGVRTVYLGSGESDATRIGLTGSWADGAMGWSAHECTSFSTRQVGGGHNDLLYDHSTIEILRDALGSSSGANVISRPSGKVQRSAIGVVAAAAGLMAVLATRFGDRQPAMIAPRVVVEPSAGPLHVPWPAQRSERFMVSVSSGPQVRVDRPVEVVMPYGTQGWGQSLAVTEVDSTGSTISGSVLHQHDQAVGGDGRTILTLLLEGRTNPATTRHFLVYWLNPGEVADVVEPEERSSLPLMQLSEGVDEGQGAFIVETPTYKVAYQKRGASISSLLDADGNDWMSFHMELGPGPRGARGFYRGTPNFHFPEGNFHPGFEVSTTEIVASGPLKTVLRSTSSEGGRWQYETTFYPTFVTSTVFAAAGPYWWLYEGTPGGEALDGGVKPFRVVRSNRADTGHRDSWRQIGKRGDWVFFRVPGLGTTYGRSLFLAQHEPDGVVDSYFLGNDIGSPVGHDEPGAMTVFGFGRDGNEMALRPESNHQFTFGFAEPADSGDAAAVIASAVEPLGIRVGPIESKP